MSNSYTFIYVSSFNSLSAQLYGVLSLAAILSLGKNRSNLDQYATCTKCGNSRPVSLFVSKNGRPLKRCSICREGLARADATRKRKANEAALAEQQRVKHRSDADAEARYRRTTPTNSSQQRANRAVCPFFPFAHAIRRERMLTLKIRLMQQRVTIVTTAFNDNENYALHQMVVHHASYQMGPLRRRPSRLQTRSITRSTKAPTFFQQTD